MKRSLSLSRRLNQEENKGMKTDDRARELQKKKRINQETRMFKPWCRRATRRRAAAYKSRDLPRILYLDGISARNRTPPRARKPGEGKRNETG